MAINNWRYVVTWGYMDENGNIVEEVQYVPDKTHDPDHIMSQINSLLNWEKTPWQVRAEDGIYKTTPTTWNTSGVWWPSTLPQGYGGPTNSDIDALVAASWGNRGWTSIFSPAETYKFQSDWYYNQWNTALGDAYKALWTWSDAYSKMANQMNDFYNIYANDIAKREMALAGVKSDLADKLYWDMSQQRQYVLDTFWPNWTLTNEINKYYDDLGNYLATDAWHQAAKIAAQWMHTWASLWAIRAQQSEAYNQSFARYVQAKEQEINAKQQIASNLINYMSTLRQEYWDTTNTYIISQYQRANDLLNSISASIAQSNIELAWTKLSNSLSKWSSSSSSSANLNRRAQFNRDVLNTDAKKQEFDNMSEAEKTAVYQAYVSSMQQKLIEDFYWNWGSSEEETDTNTETNFVINS